MVAKSRKNGLERSLDAFLVEQESRAQHWRCVASSDDLLEIKLFLSGGDGVEIWHVHADGRHERVG